MILIIRNSIFDYYSWSNWYALLDFIVILLDTKRGKRQQTPQSIGIKSNDLDLLTNELLNKHIMIWSKLFLLRHRIYVNSPGKPCIIIIDAYVKRSKMNIIWLTYHSIQANQSLIFRHSIYQVVASNNKSIFMLE